MALQQWIVNSCFQWKCICCCFDLWHGTVNINSLDCEKAFLSCGALSDLPKNQHSCFTRGITIALWLPGRFVALWTIEKLFINAISVSGIQIWSLLNYFLSKKSCFVLGGFRKGGGYSFCFSRARLVSSMRRSSISAEFHVLKGSSCGVLNMSISCWCFHGNPKVLQSPVWLLEVPPQIFLFWLPLDFPVATVQECTSKWIAWWDLRKIKRTTFVHKGRQILKSCLL